MTHIVFMPGETCEPFEYFCMSCGQMRLTFVATTNCGNCSAPITHKGEPGSLNKAQLEAEFANR